MASRENKCYKCFGYLQDQKVRFQEKQYHPHCYYCEMCKKGLSGQVCHEESGKLYCKPCYDILQEDKCSRCKTLIRSNGQTYKGKSYHEECFTCQTCGKSLVGLSFHVGDDGKFYDENCYRDVNAYKCDGCKKQIDGNDINFSIFRGNYYHHGCFACAQCKQSLSGQSFKMMLGERYCKQCR